MHINMHLGTGHQEMTVIKFGYKHPSASTPLQSAIMSRAWCYVSPPNTGLGCSSSAEMGAQTPPLALNPSFQSYCFLTDTASRQGWMIMQIDGREMRQKEKEGEVTCSST